MACPTRQRRRLQLFEIVYCRGSCILIDSTRIQGTSEQWHARSLKWTHCALFLLCSGREFAWGFFGVFAVALLSHWLLELKLFENVIKRVLTFVLAIVEIFIRSRKYVFSIWNIILPPLSLPNGRAHDRGSLRWRGFLHSWRIIANQAYQFSFGLIIVIGKLIFIGHLFLIGRIALKTSLLILLSIKYLLTAGMD